MKNNLKKNKTNIYNEKRNFILIIKRVVKEEKEGWKKNISTIFFFFFSFLLLSVVSIDKTRFRKPSASIVDKSSLP